MSRLVPSVIAILALSLVHAAPARAESSQLAIHFGAGGAALTDATPYGLVLHGAVDWQLAPPVALEAIVSGGAFFGDQATYGYFHAGAGARFRLLDDQTGYMDDGGSPHGDLSLAPHIGIAVIDTRVAFAIDAEVSYEFSVVSPLSLGVFVRPTVAFDDLGFGFAFIAGVQGQIEIDAPSRQDGDEDGDGVGNRRDRCPGTPPGTTVDRHGCVPLPPVIVLEGITFAFDSAQIEPSSERALRRAIDVLVSHPELHVEIAGHTDDQGDPAYNLRLSRDRAEAVAQYFVDHGIDRARLEVRGYGSTRPRVRGTDEASRAQNRRIELHPRDED